MSGISYRQSQEVREKPNAALDGLFTRNRNRSHTRQRGAAMNTLTTTDASRLFDWCHDPVQVCWDKADGCLGIFCISNHRYSYSMGIGDALYLQALNYDGTWRGGSAYNHGMLPPRYPVPAIVERCHIWPDCVIWSRDGGKPSIPLMSGYFSRHIYRNR